MGGNYWGCHVHITYFSPIKNVHLFLLSSLEYLDGEIQNLSLNPYITDNPYSIYPFSLEGTQKHITCVGCYFMEWDSIGTYLKILYTNGSSICKSLWSWFVGFSFWKSSLSWGFLFFFFSSFSFSSSLHIYSSFNEKCSRN